MTDWHERRYSIQPDEGYFSVGVTRKGEQVLMGLSCPNLVAFFFDPDGNLLRTGQRSVPFFQGVTPPYRIHDERIPPLIAVWKEEMGFCPTTIRVRKFFSTEHYIGIEDYPSDFHEILSDPGADEEEKAEARELVTRWNKSGQFVLQWGNDYWLDGSGRVVSS